MSCFILITVHLYQESISFCVLFTVLIMMPIISLRNTQTLRTIEIKSISQNVGRIPCLPRVLRKCVVIVLTVGRQIAQGYFRGLRFVNSFKERIFKKRHDMTFSHKKSQSFMEHDHSKVTKI